MSFMFIAYPLALALFTASGSRFDRRVAFRSPREAAFGPSRRSTAGFRRLRWRAHIHQKRRNYPMDPHRCQSTGVVASLPRQPQVRNVGAPTLAACVGGHDQPAPPVGLFGVPYPRGGPSHALFEEAEGVLQVETPDVGAPDESQVRHRPLRAVPPQ